MMNDKERKWFNNLVTTKMNEIVQEVAEKEKAQPEPQAGDVWEIGGSFIFVYTERSELRYAYSHCGPPDNVSAKEKFDFDSSRDATRIFSLTEYLKNKEESK